MGERDPGEEIVEEQFGPLVFERREKPLQGRRSSVK